jgi:CDP-2,3-bis-(O-geranylgeranyl)-sn-glycerol synthase
MQFWYIAQALFLVLVANGMPLLAYRLWPGLLAYPVDHGRCWRDGRPLLGDSKTWRGVVTSLLATGMAAIVLGHPVWVGLMAGAAAMAGDVLSSFSKRRFGLAPSDMALGIDQIPESLLPALVLAPYFRLSGGEVAVVVVLFFVLELVLSRVLFQLGLRKRPY